MGRVMSVTAEPVDEMGAVAIGFRQEWMSGSAELTTGEVLFGLDTGVGFPWLSLWVKFPDGQRVTEKIHMADFTKKWVHALLSEHRPDEIPETSL